MSKFNPMCLNYNSYKVEFAMRGAAHIHGVLWLDLDYLSILKKNNDPEQREAMDENEIDEIYIKHTAHNRKGFALGAVLAAEFMNNKSGYYGMSDLLGL